MAQKDKLFVLIKSLTFSEKAFFSKHSRTHAAKEKPDYLRLFEFIENQEAYDEAAVKAHFKGEKFIKQLARKKSQLRDKIVESLSLFHADRTSEISLRRQMNVLGVLCEKAVYEKGLIKEFERQVVSIKHAAQAQEAFTILLELIQWEQKLILLLNDKNKQEAKMLTLVEEAEKYQLQLTREIQMQNLTGRLEIILSKDIYFKLPKYKVILENLYQHLPSDKTIIEYSKKAQSHYYNIKSHYYRINGEPEKGYKYIRKTREINESMYDGSYEARTKYRNILCKELIACQSIRKYDDFFEILEKMKACNKGEENMRTLNTVLFKTLTHWMSQLELDKAAEVADQIAECHETLFSAVRFSRQAVYCYNLMITYWFTGQLKKAVYWLNYLFVQYERIKEAEKFVQEARILQLPMYYDYDDVNLSNRLDSTRRVLAERGLLFGFEEIVIACFRKLIRAVDSKECRRIISQFHDDLMEFREKYPLRVNNVWECMKVWCERQGVVPEHLHLIHEIRAVQEVVEANIE